MAESSPLTRDRFHAVIVDDDPQLLEGLRRVLRAEPYDLHTAHNAEEALPLIERIRPDVIVSDYHLPGANGMELLSRALQIVPDSCRILMTGSPSLTMVIDAINQVAVSRLFLKPFQTLHLATAIRDALERAEMARLSVRLLDQAREQQRIIERVRLSAPHLLIEPKVVSTRTSTGATSSDDYHPHDHAAILRALRQGVR